MKFFHIFAVVLVVIAFLVSAPTNAAEHSWEELKMRAITNAINRGIFKCYKDKCVIMVCDNEIIDNEFNPKLMSYMRYEDETTVIYRTRCLEV